MLKKTRLFGILLIALQIIAIIAVASTVIFLNNVSLDSGNTDEGPSSMGNTDSAELFYEVWVDGEMLCITDDLGDYFLASNTVERVMSGRLGYSHSIADDLSVKLVAIRTVAQSTPVEDICEALMTKTLALYDECYALYVGSDVVGYCPVSEKEEVQQLAVDIVKYVFDNDQSRSEISAVYAALSFAKNDKIASSTQELSSAIVSASESGVSLKDEFDDTVCNIIESIDSAILYGSTDGAPANVSPDLTVTSVRRTENETVKFEQLRAPDTDFGLKYGDDDPDFVHIKGKDGECTVEYEDVYIGDTLINTTRIDESVIITKEPVDEVTVYGTQSTTWDGGKFVWPTVGWVTSEYGDRYLSGKWQHHYGIDIARNGNPKIVAAAAGTVVYVSSHGSGSYGWNLIIDHGNGVATRYAHMCRRPAVKVGDKVYQGEYIGNMGRTGWVTGAHLHFEVFTGFVDVNNRGDFVNPRKYLATKKPAVEW